MAAAAAGGAAAHPKAVFLQSGRMYVAVTPRATILREHVEFDPAPALVLPKKKKKNAPDETSIF